MFTLKNKYGNVYKKVNTERERDELLKEGYKLVESKVETDLDKMKLEKIKNSIKE